MLIKRNYEISDETQPFSIGLVAALMFTERWIVRDVAICARDPELAGADADHVLATAVR